MTAAQADFASVSANTSDPPDWKTFGFFRGTTGGGSLFDIDTTASTYQGDLVATVSIANADKLSKVYRVLAMKITAYDSSGLIDINADNLTPDVDKDFALLTLRNGAVDIFINQANPDTYYIKLESGYYNSHIWGGGWGTGNPQRPILFCDIGQR